MGHVVVELLQPPSKQSQSKVLETVSKTRQMFGLTAGKGSKLKAWHMYFLDHGSEKVPR
jgi:hypothetical protein